MNIALSIVRKVFILSSMESQLFNPGCEGLFQQGLITIRIRWGQDTVANRNIPWSEENSRISPEFRIDLPVFGWQKRSCDALGTSQLTVDQ